MNVNLAAYMDEKNISPETVAVISTLIQMGQGLPLRLLGERERLIENATQEGFVAIENDKLFLTKKATLFLDTLLVLAKIEGEL